MSTMYDKETSLEGIRRSGVKAGQVWRHVRSSRRYFVVAVGLDSETTSPVVVYFGNDGVTWSRPLSLFLQRVNGQWRFVNDDDAAVMVTAATFVDRGLV
jgi:hypothetical protein